MRAQLLERVQDCAQLSLTDAATLAHGGASDAPGFPLLRVRNGACEALIAAQGAQLLSAVVDGDDLLWLSPRAVFADGRAIRGGVPVCLPWFGVNQQNPALPRHGFARVSAWLLARAVAVSDELTELVFSLNQFADTPHPQFPYRFRAELSLRLGSRVNLELALENTGAEPMPLSWALHSYHAVDDIQSTRVSGLDGCHYLDNTRELERFTQTGALRFDGELDRAYEQVPREQRIHGPRDILVSGENCASAIVWNPGVEFSGSIADIGADGYRQADARPRGGCSGLSGFRCAPAPGSAAACRLASTACAPCCSRGWVVTVGKRGR